MNKRSGYIVEIKSGASEGKFGIAYHAEQKAVFLNAGKLFIHVFNDRLCTDPFLTDGKPYSTLKNTINLKLIGYTD